MEYISAEDFRKQDEKVQQVFKEYFDGVSMLFLNYEKLVYWRFEDILINTPLLTEGQLRKFIEDKTGYKIEATYNYGYGYDIELTEINEVEGYDCTKIFFDSVSEDLLQAYWKVACEIAKEA